MKVISSNGVISVMVKWPRELVLEQHLKSHQKNMRPQEEEGPKQASLCLSHFKQCQVLSRVFYFSYCNLHMKETRAVIALFCLESRHRLKSSYFFLIIYLSSIMYNLCMSKIFKCFLISRQFKNIDEAELCVMLQVLTLSCSTYQVEINSSFLNAH